MPTFDEIERSMQQRVEAFYNGASILAKNKFFVGLYGDYIIEAQANMAEGSKLINGVTANKLQEGDKLAEKALEIFNRNHLSSSGDEIELKWTCSNVTIPSPRAEIKTDINIDAVKSIYYPLISGLSATSKIKLTIVEDRHMNMYQFFNALMNSFYNAKVLKPRSSFQKLALYVIVMNGDRVVKDIDKQEYSIEDVPLQVFEFNSVVPLGMSELDFSTQSPTKKQQFDITFEAPNPFQASYKTIAELRGIRNNTSSSGFLKEVGTDLGGVDTIGNYKTRIPEQKKDSTNSHKTKHQLTVFELDPSKLNSGENGVY